MIILNQQSKVSPVRIADLLGEQLLTEVNAFLKITLRFAKAFKFGVLQTMLLYTCVSKPASSPMITKTFFFVFTLAVVELRAIKTRQIASIITCTTLCSAIFCSDLFVTGRLLQYGIQTPNDKFASNALSFCVSTWQNNNYSMWKTLSKHIEN